MTGLGVAIAAVAAAGVVLTAGRAAADQRAHLRRARSTSCSGTGSGAAPEDLVRHLVDPARARDDRPRRRAAGGPRVSCCPRSPTSGSPSCCRTACTPPATRRRRRWPASTGCTCSARCRRPRPRRPPGRWPPAAGDGGDGALDPRPRPRASPGLLRSKGSRPSRRARTTASSRVCASSLVIAALEVALHRLRRAATAGAAASRLLHPSATCARTSSSRAERCTVGACSAPASAAAPSAASRVQASSSRSRRALVGGVLGGQPQLGVHARTSSHRAGSSSPRGPAGQPRAAPPAGPPRRGSPARRPSARRTGRGRRAPGRRPIPAPGRPRRRPPRGRPRHQHRDGGHRAQALGEHRPVVLVGDVQRAPSSPPRRPGRPSASTRPPRPAPARTSRPRRCGVRAPSSSPIRIAVPRREASTGPAKTTLIPDCACTSRTAARSTSPSSGARGRGGGHGGSQVGDGDPITLSEPTRRWCTCNGCRGRHDRGWRGVPARAQDAGRTRGDPAPMTESPATARYRAARDQLLALSGDHERAVAEFRWPEFAGRSTGPSTGSTPIARGVDRPGAGHRRGGRHRGVLVVRHPRPPLRPGRRLAARRRGCGRATASSSCSATRSSCGSRCSR